MVHKCLDEDFFMERLAPPSEIVHGDFESIPFLVSKYTCMNYQYQEKSTVFMQIESNLNEVSLCVN